jgi:hypothetical protein
VAVLLAPCAASAQWQQPQQPYPQQPPPQGAAPTGWPTVQLPGLPGFGQPQQPMQPAPMPTAQPTGEPAKVPYVTEALKDAPGVLVAASDYLKVLPDSIDRWLPRPLVALGTDGFGRSENRTALRDFFEVDHRYVVVATLSALARDKKIDAKVAQDAIAALGINPEKSNPAIS